VKSIQEKNVCVYTVLGTHWNTLYPDCIRNIHAVNGCGYTVPGTHWNTLRHCFQLVPGIYMCPKVWVVRRPMRVCCGNRWGWCVLFTNIWDSLTAPCLVYNAAMYTVYGRCSQYGRCIFIHWPVRPVWPVRGLYGTGCCVFRCTQLKSFCLVVLSHHWDQTLPYGRLSNTTFHRTCTGRLAATLTGNPFRPCLQF